MIESAGSMDGNVANNATCASRVVAKTATDLRVSSRYRYNMFSEWIQAALRRAGDMSQAELARRMNEWRPGIERSIVNKVVRGKRRLSAEELVEISRITGHPLPEVESRLTIEAPHGIPMVGIVGPGGVIADFDVHDVIERLPMVEAANASTKTVQIQGEGLGKIFDGWVAYFDYTGEAPGPEWHDRLCVVKLRDGRVLVRTLEKGTLPSRWHLTSSFDPPMYDMDVEWAAPILSLKPPYVAFFATSLL